MRIVMPSLLFLKKRQNLKLSSAANYRWRFRVNLFSRTKTKTLKDGSVFCKIPNFCGIKFW